MAEMLKNADARIGSPDDDDFSVKNAHRSGRPSKIDDKMKALVQISIQRFGSLLPF